MNTGMNGTVTMADELKPCPFCGCEAIYRTYDCVGKPRWTVYCSSAFCPGFTSASNSDDREIAARMWNQRGKENELDYQLGCLRAENAILRRLVEALEHKADFAEMSARFVLNSSWENEQYRGICQTVQSARAALEAVENESCPK